MRWWAVATAVGLALALATFWPWLAAYGGRPPSHSYYLPAMPVAALLLLAMSRLFRFQELALIMTLLLGVCGVAGSGLVNPWYDALFARTSLVRDPATARLAEHFPAALTVAIPAPTPAGAMPSDTALVVEGFDRGQQSGLPPFAPLWPPLLMGGLIVAGWLAIALGLMALTHRQWRDHERLQHPLSEVTGTLCDGSWLNRFFGIGLLLAIIPWWWGIGADLRWHPFDKIPAGVAIPELPRLLGMSQPEGGYALSSWYTLTWRPCAIGIAFLMVPAVGFSAWAGFWVSMLVVGLVYNAGIPVDFSIHGRGMGGGAMVAFAVLVAYYGRHHFSRLFAAAVGLGNANGDRLGVWGARAMLAGAVLAGGLLSWLGGHWAAGPLAVLLALTAMLVLARIVAESGLVAFQTAQDLVPFSYSLGLSSLLPTSAVFAVMWIGAVGVHDTRTTLSGHLAHGDGLASRSGLRPGLVILILAVVLPVAIVLAMSGRLYTAWTISDQAPQIFNWKPTELLALQAGGGGGSPLWPLLVGAGLVAAAALIRRTWSNAWIHPIGVVAAFSPPVWLIWASLMGGWLAKMLTMRWGGLAMYQRLRPLAIGLIIGDMCGMTCWSLWRLYIS